MASVDRFMIAPINTGLETDIRPWLIADDAFAELTNAYVFRGRVVKRFGAKLMQANVAPTLGYEQLQSRLRINLGSTNGSGTFLGSIPSSGPYIVVGSTDGSGNSSGTVPIVPGKINDTFLIGGQLFVVTVPNGALSTSGSGSGTFDISTGNFTFSGCVINSNVLYNAYVPNARIGQMFSVGNNIFTVYQLGTPAAMNVTGIGSATYNTTTGAVSITGAAASTAVYFYPAQPVMGLVNYESKNINNEPLFAFDTQFAYQYDANGWTRLGSAVWTGTDSDFFWASNYRGITEDLTYLYATNYHTGTTLNDSDTMYYWDGSSWNVFNPGFLSGTATSTILSARIITPFKDRLILLNTVENTGMSPGTNATYVNRCRYSWIGDPTNAAAFYENVPGNGGFIDAPTKEAIITAQNLRDRLIVYIESSTWELAYTGNQILPFVWQQINTELGAESTFSQVPFDKYVLGVGNVGIHSCNGANVERIDNKIPDSVFEIHNDNNGVKRVYGIRDYYAETVYWTFPGEGRSLLYPYNNRILVYNYKTGSWAFNDDSITVFGYYQVDPDSTNPGDTWTGSDYQWQETNIPWKSATINSQFRYVVAGNQEGFVFIITSNDQLANNCPALQITNLNPNSGTFTVVNHNLRVGDFVKVLSCQGLTGINGTIYKVLTLVDANTFTVNMPGVTGTYTGGGTLTRITPINIKTKQYNFYVQDGRNAYIPKVDFLVLRTADGEFSVDYFVSSSEQSLNEQSVLTGSRLGSNVVETRPYDLIPFEQAQERLWHPAYLFADGECIQLELYLTDEQATNPDIVESGFELHAMTFYATPTSSRLQ